MKLFDVYPLYDVTPVSAKGAVLTDINGTEYLDLYGGHAVISIGLCSRVTQEQLIVFTTRQGP